ncbi:MAG: plastocyanin/azurin family copper-binding protein [Acidobacteriota bacterium]|nr:plastocyanin/azurin family copper-binding protein [Acidobacteriota bacterium]
MTARDPRTAKATPATFLAGLALALLATVLPARAARADQTVTIGPGISFNPSSVTIAPGERVTWTWAAGGHSTTTDTATGPEVWDSGVQPFGASFSHVFTTPGSFPYYCQVHSVPGGTAMNGVVQVVVPTVTPTVRPTVPPTPSVTALPPPSPTSLGGGIPPSGAIPTLDKGGLAFLAVALALASLVMILRSLR